MLIAAMLIADIIVIDRRSEAAGGSAEACEARDVPPAVAVSADLEPRIHDLRAVLRVSETDSVPELVEQ